MRDIKIHDFNSEQPPLAKFINALPLLFIKPALPKGIEQVQDWKDWRNSPYKRDADQLIILIPYVPDSYNEEYSELRPGKYAVSLAKINDPYEPPEHRRAFDFFLFFKPVAKIGNTINIL